MLQTYSSTQYIINNKQHSNRIAINVLFDNWEAPQSQIDLLNLQVKQPPFKLIISNIRYATFRCYRRIRNEWIFIF